jgi:hypothetical protein
MKRQSPFLRAIGAGVIAVAVLTGGTARARAQYAVFDADAALQVFHERVESYAALHRRLAPPPSSMTSTDPLSKLLTRQYLASALRSTRRFSQQGEIFSPEIATLFRWMLADSIGELDGEGFLTALNGGVAVPPGLHPTVNETYTMLPLYRIPPDVRLGLPKLPGELDYRLAGHDLVLWDIYAGIVVDFVPDVVMSPVATN